MEPSIETNMRGAQGFSHDVRPHVRCRIKTVQEKNMPAVLQDMMAKIRAHGKGFAIISF